MRRILFFACCILASVNSLMMKAQSNKNVIDEVVWVVGDDAIYRSEVEQGILEARAQGHRFNNDPYCFIPEQMAVQKLFLHQASLDSVQVTDSEIFANVDARIEFFIENIGSKEKMEEYFRKSTSQIREQLYETEKKDLLVKSVQRSLMSKVKVTPAQVKEFFKNVPEDSVPFVPTQVEVQILVRQPEVSQEEIDRVKSDLRNYTERVNSGKDRFSTLAVMYSQDEGSAARGGELGFKGRMELVPEFSSVAFNLNDDKTVSKIFESEYGFHIVQLIEKRGDKINCRHILRKPRVTDQAIEKCILFVDSVCDEIRRGEYSFEEKLPKISDDKESRNNYGILANNYIQNEESENYGTSKFEMKELPPEIARVFANMQIGEISKPFIMINKKGKEVVAAVRLKNRVNGHRATLKEDFQLMQQVVISRRSAELIDKWIRDKQKTTYVRINEGWQNCEFQYPGWIKE